jgi:hypothetical protein
MTNDAPSETLDELLDKPEQDPVEADPDEWLIAPARARRLPKLTAALVAGIVLAAAFTGGPAAQPPCPPARCPPGGSARSAAQAKAPAAAPPPRAAAPQSSAPSSASTEGSSRYATSLARP